jgi:hypothetical protein
VRPRRHRLIAWGLAAVIAAGLLAALAPLPIGLLDAASEADALAARLADAAARRPDLARLEARRAALEVSDATAAPVLRAVDLPDAERALSSHLAAVLAGAGVELADERPLASLSDGGLLVLRRRVSLRLPAERLEPLLLALETARPAVFVEAIEVERRDGEALAATLDLRAPAEIAPARAAKAPTAAAPRDTASASRSDTGGEAVAR